MGILLRTNEAAKSTDLALVVVYILSCISLIERRLQDRSNYYPTLGKHEVMHADTILLCRQLPLALVEVSIMHYEGHSDLLVLGGTHARGFVQELT